MKAHKKFSVPTYLKDWRVQYENQELELQVAPMSNDTMEYLNVLFGVCKRFKTDYYHLAYEKTNQEERKERPT